MLDVLQDDNYIIKQVNVDMGFFNASKEANAENGLEKFWQTFWINGRHSGTLQLLQNHSDIWQLP